jgi:hypothetical protein
MVIICRRDDASLHESPKILKRMVLINTNEIKIASEIGNSHVSITTQLLENKDARREVTRVK